MTPPLSPALTEYPDKKEIAMTRMTFEMIAAEGTRISGVLSIMERLMSDPLKIKEQVIQLRVNGDKQSAKLQLLTKALDLPCLDCDHPRASHDNGKARCGEGRVIAGVTSHCSCTGWVIEFHG